MTIDRDASIPPVEVLHPGTGKHAPRLQAFWRRLIEHPADRLPKGSALLLKVARVRFADGAVEIALPGGMPFDAINAHPHIRDSLNVLFADFYDAKVAVRFVKKEVSPDATEHEKHCHALWAMHHDEADETYVGVNDVLDWLACQDESIYRDAARDLLTYAVCRNPQIEPDWLTRAGVLPDGTVEISPEADARLRQVAALLREECGGPRMDKLLRDSPRTYDN